jgi:hypothetical protein
VSKQAKKSRIEVNHEVHAVVVVLHTKLVVQVKPTPERIEMTTAKLSKGFKPAMQSREVSCESSPQNAPSYVKRPEDISGV